MSMSVNIIEVWKLSCFDWGLCTSYIEGDDVTFDSFRRALAKCHVMPYCLLSSKHHSASYFIHFFVEWDPRVVAEADGKGSANFSEAASLGSFTVLLFEEVPF